jgi:hypothetical protein
VRLGPRFDLARFVTSLICESARLGRKDETGGDEADEPADEDTSQGAIEKRCHASALSRDGFNMVLKISIEVLRVTSGLKCA